MDFAHNINGTAFHFLKSVNCLPLCLQAHDVSPVFCNRVSVTTSLAAFKRVTVSLLCEFSGVLSGICMS